MSVHSKMEKRFWLCAERFHDLHFKLSGKVVEDNQRTPGQEDRGVAKTRGLQNAHDFYGSIILLTMAKGMIFVCLESFCWKA